MIYNQQLHLIEPDSIKSIVNPLAPLGIVGFFFVRMYPDGRFVNLSSDASWTDFFLKKFYATIYTPDDMVTHTLMTHGVALSELNPQNLNWKDGKEYFNVGNAIILSKHYEDYYENHFFYAHKNNQQINQFYLNHLDLLYQFIDYFKQKAHSLILEGEANKFYTPEKYLSHRLNHSSENLQNLPIQQIKQFFKENNSTQVQQTSNTHGLSKKEIVCLSHLIQGKSAEESSLMLSCSRRTIEAHIESAKRKLNCHKISQLAYLLGKLNVNLN